METIQLWLVHPEQDACAAFRFRFDGMPNVSLHQNLFEELPPHDCFVTAGNSYGQMSAGIDAAVVHFFGKSLESKVQHRILNDYLGEQPVGTAFIVETEHETRPFVCHAPTMRTPGSIEGTDKVYVATWASLLAVYQHNVSTKNKKIRSVAFPAFGCGFGGMSYDECARQMSAAWYHFNNLPHRSLDWDWVIARQKRICYDGKTQVCR